MSIVGPRPLPVDETARPDRPSPPPAVHPPGPDLPVAGQRTQRSDVRRVDGAGSRVRRSLDAVAGCRDPAAHDPGNRQPPRRALAFSLAFPWPAGPLPAGGRPLTRVSTPAPDVTLRTRVGFFRREGCACDITGSPRAGKSTQAEEASGRGATWAARASGVAGWGRSVGAGGPGRAGRARPGGVGPGRGGSCQRAGASAEAGPSSRRRTRSA